jgi:Tfp pilus assembly protein PilO
MKWPKKNKISAIDAGGIAVCAGLVGLFALGVAVPLLNHRRTIQDAQVVLAAAKTKAASMTLQLNLAKVEMEKARRAVAANPLVLQDDEQLDQRVSDLGIFCKSCGLEVEDVTPGAALAYPQYQTIPVHIAARGSYRNCLTFLHEVHAHFLDIGVKAFRLSGVSVDDTAALGAQFDLIWYAKNAATVVSAQ